MFGLYVANNTIWLKRPWLCIEDIAKYLTLAFNLWAKHVTWLETEASWRFFIKQKTNNAFFCVIKQPVNTGVHHVACVQCYELCKTVQRAACFAKYIHDDFWGEIMEDYLQYCRLFRTPAMCGLSWCHSLQQPSHCFYSPCEGCGKLLWH